MYGKKLPCDYFFIAFYRIANTSSIVKKLPTNNKRNNTKTDSIKKSDNFNLLVGEWSTKNKKLYTVSDGYCHCAHVGCGNIHKKYHKV